MVENQLAAVLKIVEQDDYEYRIQEDDDKEDEEEEDEEDWCSGLHKFVPIGTRWLLTNWLVFG